MQCIWNNNNDDKAIWKRSIGLTYNKLIVRMRENGFDSFLYNSLVCPDIWCKCRHHRFNSPNQPNGIKRLKWQKVKMDLGLFNWVINLKINPLRVQNVRFTLILCQHNHKIWVWKKISIPLQFFYERDDVLCTSGINQLNLSIEKKMKHVEMSPDSFCLPNFHHDHVECVHIFEGKNLFFPLWEKI